MITVIVPVYNAKKYLNRCIDSILAQTYKDIEIILVDDGSTDGSSMICDRYAAENPNVKVIHKENGGHQSARIAGVDAAAGEYVGFIDADDWIEPEMYEQLASGIKDSDLITSGYIKNGPEGDVIFTVHDLMEPGNYEINESPFIDSWFFSKDYDGIDTTSGGLINSLCIKLFRMNIVKETFPATDIGIACCEDYLSLTHYLLKCRTVTVTHGCFYHYCVNEESITHKTGNRIIIDQGKLYNSIVGAIKGHPQEKKLLRQFQKRFVFELQPMIIEQLGMDNDLRFPRYRYPSYDDIYKKKVILFGAGHVGRDYFADWINNDLLTVVSWTDNKKAGMTEMGRMIDPPGDIKTKDYDVIVCAVLSENFYKSIKDQLMGMGIPEERILWKKPIDYLYEYYKRLDDR